MVVHQLDIVMKTWCSATHRHHHIVVVKIVAEKLVFQGTEKLFAILFIKSADADSVFFFEEMVNVQKFKIHPFSEESAGLCFAAAHVSDEEDTHIFIYEKSRQNY